MIKDYSNESFRFSDSFKPRLVWWSQCGLRKYNWNWGFTWFSSTCETEVCLSLKICWVTLVLIIFWGGILVFSWPQGGKGTCRRGNGERERGRGLWGGNGIQQVQTGAGGSGDRVGHPRSDKGSGERTEEGEEAGSQLARRPPGLLTRACTRFPPAARTFSVLYH